MAYITGFHAIEEHIKSGKTGTLLVAKPGPRAKEIVSLAIENHIRIERVGTFDLDRLAKDHRQIALETDFAKDTKENNNIRLEDFIADLGDRERALALILDEITDPHNYGAILRTCDQFAVDIVISRNRRTAKNAEVISKTSSGAVSWVKSSETPNLVRAVEELKKANFWVYGADMKGESLYEKDLSGRVAIVLGGEGSGLSRLLKETCDTLISIPTTGKLDSLNVSVACGIILYESQRPH
jgi:23S rRNA (guanosine2251-2'-O)-methyltransferase